MAAQARTTGEGALRALDLGLLALGVLLAVLIVRAALSGGAALGTTRALAEDPLDTARLAARGLALRAAGRDDLATPLLELAGRAGWRDQRVQAFLLREASVQGLWPEAMEHADALLRADSTGALRPWLFGWLNSAAAFNEPRAALVDRLEAPRCWWRGAWLQQLGATPSAGAADDEGANELLRALAASPRPPTAAEYGPYVMRLASSSQAAQALSVWEAMTHRADAPLRDGTFTAGSDGTPFTWSPASGVGATSAIEPTDHGGNDLRVDYDGFSTPTMPAQLLVLGPGAWRLTWRERAAGPASMTWRVRCAASGAVLAGATSTPSPAWTGRSLEFLVPSAACASQWLELTPSPGERREETSAWYERFRLGHVG
jgi:hypothetical protein